MDLHARPGITERVPKMPEEFSLLLAEDDPTTRLIIERVMRLLGCALTTFDNGKDAAEVAELQKFDLIMLDIKMPVMNGHDAARLIKKSKLNCDTPLIAFSAACTTADRLTGMAAGFDDFMAKPLTEQALTKKVHWHMRNKSAVLGALAGKRMDSVFTDDPGYKQAIAQFIQQLPHTIQKMIDAFKAGDDQGLRGLAHSLKGTGGMAGFPVFTQLARQLERQIDSGDKPAATDTLTRLREVAAKQATR
jgi:CheY-like chemotaxis protein